MATATQHKHTDTDTDMDTDTDTPGERILIYSGAGGCFGLDWVAPACSCLIDSEAISGPRPTPMLLLGQSRAVYARI